jgi:hypothetical protein
MSRHGPILGLRRAIPDGNSIDDQSPRLSGAPAVLLRQMTRLLRRGRSA